MSETKLLPIGTRVAVQGVVIARVNEHREESYRSYNIRLADGQQLNTNVRNTRSLEEQHAKEQAAREAETDELQEQLNALLEEQAETYQAEVEALKKAHQAALEALQTSFAEQRHKTEAAEAKVAQAATLEAALRAEIHVLKAQTEKKKSAKPAPEAEKPEETDAPATA